MYTRGQFAIIGKVTRKALRIYEEKKLLIPDEINPENGYHYYGKEQLDNLYRILQYKTLGFSLDEIKEIITNNQVEDELLEKRRVKLNQEMKDNLYKKNLLEKYIANMDENKQLAREPYLFENIIWKKKTILYKEEEIELQNVGRIAGGLFEIAARNQLIVVGVHYICYDNIFEVSGNIHSTLCLPVDKSVQELSREEPETKCIRTIHRNGFSTIGKAHEAMADYTETNKIELTGKVFECYNQDLSVAVYYEIKE